MQNQLHCNNYRGEKIYCVVLQYVQTPSIKYKYCAMF